MVKCNPRTRKEEKENNILRLHFFYFMIMKTEFYTYSNDNDKECIIFKQYLSKNNRFMSKILWSEYTDPSLIGYTWWLQIFQLSLQ